MINIVFFLYDNMTALDLIGPHEILCRLPGAKVRRVALVKGPIQTDSGIVLEADYSIAEIHSGDVLLIPGAGNATCLKQYPSILAWLKSIHTTTKWTTSVCTGSLILAATGILSGVKATTHWATMDRLEALGAKPVDKRIVEEGKFLTAAGVSAGIDMALILAEKIAGPSIAQAMQLGIEYDPEPPFNVGSPKKAPPTLCNEVRIHMTSLFEPL